MSKKIEADDAMGDLLDQLCQRNEDLQSEKLALCDEVDALTKQNIELRKALAGHESELIKKRQRFSEVTGSMGQR